MVPRAHRRRSGPLGAFQQSRLRRVGRALVNEPEFNEVLIHSTAVEDSLVASHWVAYVPRVLEALAGLFLLAVVPVTSLTSAWLPLLVGLGLCVDAAWSSYVTFMDVLVITEIRIFRITGVPWRKRASMPLARVLDITVQRSFLGAVLGYGHFTFESAAQTQGMKDVRFVPHPSEWEKFILQHVHASNLRFMSGGNQPRGPSR
jgi:hypothetical protein